MCFAQWALYVWIFFRRAVEGGCGIWLALLAVLSLYGNLGGTLGHVKTEFMPEALLGAPLLLIVTGVAVAAVEIQEVLRRRHIDG